MILLVRLGVLDTKARDDTAQFPDLKRLLTAGVTLLSWRGKSEASTGGGEERRDEWKGC